MPAAAVTASTEAPGPYHQWSAKVNGKTVTRRLSATEAALDEEWITNDRKLRRLIDQMRTVAAKAAEIQLATEPKPQPRGLVARYNGHEEKFGL